MTGPNRGKWTSIERTPLAVVADFSNSGLRQRLAVDEHLGQELERRDPARAVALDLVAHRAGHVVGAADDLVPVALAERGGDVEIEPLGGEHQHDLAVELVGGERRALGLGLVGLGRFGLGRGRRLVGRRPGRPGRPLGGPGLRDGAPGIIENRSTAASWVSITSDLR